MKRLIAFTSILVSILVVRTPALLAASDDGQTDIFWHNQQLGHAGVWYMRGEMFESAAWITNTWGPDWKGAGTADFNNDGHTDLLVRNSLTGENAIWLMHGATVMTRQPIHSAPPNLQLIGAADFNTDSDPDLLWHTNATGLVWFMQGTNWTGTVGWLPELPSRTSRFTAPADFNADGHTDLIVHDASTGAGALWHMRGTNRLEILEIARQPDLSYSLTAAGVFNPVGHMDLLWRNSSGSNQLWRMQGPRLLRKLDLRHEPNTNWTIIGTGGFTDEAFVGAASAQFRSKTPDHHRGTLLLVVDRTVAKPLAAELEILQRDLVGDGWRVISTNAARHNDSIPLKNMDAVASIKAFVTNSYQASGDAKVVFLIGHVAIPYSGFASPDGHGGRALPADGYYGDIDGVYTDSKLDYASFFHGPHESRHDNRPGDGKWDQQSFPTSRPGQTALELAVGRVDFARLPAFRPQRELDLLRQYLRKNHKYRHKQLAFPDRVIVGNYLPSRKLTTPLHQHALAAARAWFGSAPHHISEGDLFLVSSGGVWGFHGGWGLPYGIKGALGDYHTTAQLARGNIEPQTAFCSLFGSYFLDWDIENCILRAALAGTNGGLGAMWFNPSAHSSAGYRSLAQGQPIAEGLIQLASTSMHPYGTPMFFAFLGDPTLRLQVTEPPSDLMVAAASPFTLKWRPPLNGGSHYVYMSTNGWNGPWNVLSESPLSEAEFVHKSPPQQPRIYKVRSAARIHTGNNSFTNLSQGIFLDLRD